MIHLLNQVVYIYWQSQGRYLKHSLDLSFLIKGKINLFLALDKWLFIFNQEFHFIEIIIRALNF